MLTTHFTAFTVPRIIIAAIYKHLNETMKLLWNDAMRLNTVHVSDVCAAIWQLAQSPKTASQVYNIVDDSASTQGSISNLLVDIFDINVDYFGIVMSNLTKVCNRPYYLAFIILIFSKVY